MKDFDEKCLLANAFKRQKKLILMIEKSDEITILIIPIYNSIQREIINIQIHFKWTVLPHMLQKMDLLAVNFFCIFFFFANDAEKSFFPMR